MATMDSAAEKSESKAERATIIRIEDVSLSFGGVNALSEISLDVRSDEILAIIGPNGAGKTAPRGISHIWERLRNYYQAWPY